MLEILIIMLLIYFIWIGACNRKLNEKIDKINLHFQEVEYKLNQLDKKLDKK